MINYAEITCVQNSFKSISCRNQVNYSAQYLNSKINKEHIVRRAFKGADLFSRGLVERRRWE